MSSLSPLAGISTTLYVTQLAGSMSHICVLFSDMHGRCFGDNTHGQLGTGDQIAKYDLATAGILSSSLSIVQIAATKSATCILTASGKVRCVGARGDNTGQLGQGSNIGVEPLFPSSAPITNFAEPSVVVVSLAVGTADNSHMCAVFANGGVRCW